MSKVAIVGDASGTGTFTISAPNGNTDRTLVLPDEAGTVLTSAGVPASAMPAGSVIQVVYTLDAAVTSDQVTSSTTFIDVDGMSVTITPRFSTSKLLVFARFMSYVSGGASPYMLTTIARDGVNTSSSTYSFGYTQGDIYVAQPLNLTTIVSANNTNPTTFKAQMRLGGGGATQCQTDKGDKLIYVMEIAA